jgi:hypothetical protein
MKKLIYLFLLMSLTSCVKSYVDTNQSSTVNIPYDVSQKLMTDTLTQQVFIYKHELYHYVFDQNKKFISRYYVENDLMNVWMALFILILLFIIITIFDR